MLSKLRQVPRLVQAARDNIKDPPAIFVKTGIDTLRGIVTFIDADLPRAFSGVDDMHLLADLADASTEAVHTDRRYVDRSRDRGAAQGQGARSGSGATGSSASCALDEGLPLPVERLLAIAEARAGQDAGGVPHAGRPAQRRRSDRGVAQGEAAAPARRAR